MGLGHRIQGDQAMNCPHCNHDKSMVTGTRHQGSTNQTWRHRKCLAAACGKSFVSVEQTAADMRFPKGVENVNKSQGKAK
jgi:transcriptional regulator NrdR family protein